MTSFTDVQQDFGNPRYPSVDGYAPCSTRKAWTTASIASVVTPGATAAAPARAAWAAIRPATRIRSIVSAVWTCGPRYGSGAALPT